MRKKNYTIWACNDSGAGFEVSPGREITSINEAAAIARGQLGSGWCVKIFDEDRAVKSFTIR